MPVCIGSVAVFLQYPFHVGETIASAPPMRLCVSPLLAVATRVVGNWISLEVGSKDLMSGWYSASESFRQ